MLNRQDALKEYEANSPFFKAASEKGLLRKVFAYIYEPDGYDAHHYEGDFYFAFVLVYVNIMVTNDSFIYIRCREGGSLNRIRTEDLICRIKDTHPKLAKLMLFNMDEFEK